MDAWIIILVTILSGLALFSLIFFCAKRRAAKRTRRQAIPVTVTVQGAPGFQSQQMMTHVPSTSYSPAYNSNMPTMVIEQPARIGHRQEFVMVQQSQPMMIQQPQPNIQYYSMKYFDKKNGEVNNDYF